MYDSRTCKSREMHVAYKFPKMIALTSSILTSSKREIDRVNQLSEPTTCWHWFVPILVLGLPCLPWVQEAFQARCPVSVSLDPREKRLERSAVPLMEGTDHLTFQIDRRLKYFQKLLIVSVFRWLWVVFGGFRSFHILAPTLLETMSGYLAFSHSVTESSVFNLFSVSRALKFILKMRLQNF